MVGDKETVGSVTDLIDLLTRVRDGEISPRDGAEILKELPFRPLEEMKLDHHRAIRRGVPEVVYGGGKSFEQLRAVTEEHLRSGRALLISRVDPESAQRLAALSPDLVCNPTARTVRLGSRGPENGYDGTVALVGAGASDAPVVEETAETLTYLDCPHSKITDAGIAGMHRFLTHWEELKMAPVIVAVAGMEGALPSVLAGLFPGPVIGVPTSVGYGAHFGGIAPLLGMLNSCTGGVAVVNIDNGVAAGYIASLVNRTR